MLNEERVILMTKLAAYEQNEGMNMVAVGKYFRSDYIGIQGFYHYICFIHSL